MALGVMFILGACATAFQTNAWLSTASIALFAWAMWTYYRLEPLFLYLALPFAFNWAWCLLSMRYLEGGAYITEQFTYGTLTGATARFALLALAFLTVVALSVNNFARKPQLTDPFRFVDRDRLRANFARISMLLWLVLIVALIATGLVYGFPLLTGQSRFAYWPTTPGLQRLEYLLPCAMLPLGVRHHVVGGRRNILALLAGIGMMVLFSDKFSGPLTSLMYFVMGYFTARALDPSVTKRHVGLSRAIIVGPIVAALLVGTTWYGYAAINGEQPQQIRQTITNRALGLQGHVYFGVDRAEVVDHTDTVTPGDFLKKNHEPDNPGGLVQLMYEVSPRSFVASMRASGIRFTNGYPAIAVAAFGFWGALGVQVIIGLLFGLFAYYVSLKVARLDIAGLLLATVFLENILTNALLMGDVFYLYRPLSLVLLSAMCWEHLSSNARAKKRAHEVAQTMTGMVALSSSTPSSTTSDV